MVETPLAELERPKWLLWLIYVRFLIYSIIIPITLLLRRRFGDPEDMKNLLAVVVGLSFFWWLLVKLNKSYVIQAYSQIAVDLLLITWAVNRTGGVDSYFSSLYFLTIVMSSILLGRRGVFFAGTVSSVVHFVHMDLSYFHMVPSTMIVEEYTLPALQFIIALNIFAYCSVAYLSNYLAESLRRTGSALHKSTGKIAYLQAFSGQIVDSMASAVATTDTDGRIFLFNKAAEKLTMRPAKDASSRFIWDVIPGIRLDSKTPNLDIWTKRPDGKDMYLRYSVSPIMIDEQDSAGYVWCFDDFTEMRLLERQVRQKEQMASIGRLSSAIAHEIRNPLASISGSFKMLQSGLELTAEQSQLADIILRETERLNRTISEFLNYSRPPALQLRRMDLSCLVSETVSLMRNSPDLTQHHSIETRLERVFAMVDENMMRQVFYNLATNAFRAMPDGGTLTISVEPRNGAQIRFEDTGIGMDDNEVKNLFVPFHSTFKNGTGLGLPMVYQIIAAHNGVIGVKSARGAGSTFFIDLKQ